MVSFVAVVVVTAVAVVVDAAAAAAAVVVVAADTKHNRSHNHDGDQFCGSKHHLGWKADVSRGRRLAYGRTKDDETENHVGRDFEYGKQIW